MDQEWPYWWRLEAVPTVAGNVTVLTKEEDRRLRQWLRNDSPVSKNFPGTGLVTFDMEDCEEETGTKFLLTLEVNLNDMCTLMWAGVPAVRVPVQLCFAHFYDFWYPGSDDLWVIDDSLTWMLECNHHGYLRFTHLSPP